MGGCVIPPGTAAMCQTGGEEESGSERAEERREGVGREKVVEGSRRKRKMEKEKNRVAGQRHCLAVLQLSVKMTYRTH